MGVEREETTDFLHGGKTSVLRAVRQAAGNWSVEFLLEYTLTLEDGRRVRVDRHVMVRAAEQIGRKRVMEMPTQETAVEPPEPAHCKVCGDDCDGDFCGGNCCLNQHPR